MKYWIKFGGRWQAIVTAKDMLKKSGLKVKWDSLQKLWWVNLKTYYELQLLKDVIKDIKKKTCVQVVTSGDEFENKPAKVSKHLYDFQKEGVEKLVALLNYQDSAFLLDEMGLGKSLQAIEVVKNLGVRKIIIISPKVLKLNWKNEILKWQDQVNIELVETKNLKDINKQTNETTYYLMHYELLGLKKYQSLLRDLFLAADFLILDECHKLKNYKSNRAKFLASILREKSIKKLFLTGTPIQNRAEELYTLLRLAGWSDIKFLKSHFVRRFDGWGAYLDIVNPEKLANKLAQLGCIRRTKEMVMKDLPSKTRVLIKVQASDDEVKMMNKLIETWRDRGTTGLDLESAIAEYLDIPEDELKDNMLKYLQAVLLKMWELKKDKFFEFIEDIVFNEQIVIFTSHKSVLNEIAEWLTERNISFSKVHGGMNDLDRQLEIRNFIEGKSKVFLATIRASSEGLTLTNARIVVFAELDFNPQQLQQAEARVHRISQDKPVFVYYIVLDKSYEIKILNILEKKERLAQAINTNLKSEQDCCII